MNEPWNRPATQLDLANAEKRILLAIGRLSYIVNRQGMREMATLADIQTKVANETTVENSAILLMQELSAELKAALANNDQAMIDSIATQLDTNAATLAAAITANTPAAPPAA